MPEIETINDSVRKFTGLHLYLIRFQAVLCGCAWCSALWLSHHAGDCATRATPRTPVNVNSGTSGPWPTPTGK
jgi:hypothetical protein